MIYIIGQCLIRMKQKHHDEVFEDELKKIYEFGKEMVNNPW